MSPGVGRGGGRTKRALVAAFGVFLAASGQDADAQPAWGGSADGERHPSVEGAAGAHTSQGAAFVEGAAKRAAESGQAQSADTAAKQPAPTAAQRAQRDEERREVRAAIEGFRGASAPAFCERVPYELRASELQYCELAETLEKRCPGLGDACARAAQDRRAETRRVGAKELPEIPEAVKAVASLFLWSVLILLAAALLVWGVRRLLAERKELLKGEATLGPAEGDREDEGAPDPMPETNIDKLLAGAQAAAEEGDYALAVSRAYAAALRGLDQVGLIFVHRSQTNGDYVRSLSSRPELQAQLGAVVRQVEAVQFGTLPATKSRFEQLLSLVRPLLHLSSLGCLLVLVGALMGGCGAGEETAERFLAPSERPGGHLVLSRLLERRGVSVHHRVKRVDSIGEDVAVIVVLTNPLSTSEWKVLDAWTRAGGVLVVAAAETPVHPALGVRLGPDRCQGALVYDNDRAELELYGLEGPTLQYESDSGAWTTLACRSRKNGAMSNLIVSAEVESGVVVFFASSSLVSNASLLAGDNAMIADDLLNYGGDVELIGDWTGTGAESPLATIKGSGLGPWLLHVLAISFVFGWSHWYRFGSPRTPRGDSRRAFVQHVVALGRLYERARAAAHALGAYGEWAVERLRERVLPSRRGGMTELAEAIAARTGRSEAEVMTTLVRLHDASHGEGADENAHETFLRLQAYLRETGGRQ